MVFATATSKGQITIPAAIRQRLGIEPGTRIRFIPTKEGYEMRTMPEDSLKRMQGMFSNNGRNLTLDELNEAIGSAATQSGMQGLDSHAKISSQINEASDE